MISVYLLENKYEVPEGITIIEAFEYAGISMLHSKGCESGFCGACAVLYKVKDEPGIKACLACKTKVRDGMRISALPGFEVDKSRYSPEKSAFDKRVVCELYPEVASCKNCGICTRFCPKGIRVRDIVGHAKSGDIAFAAENSFKCVMCGACAEKCPAGIKPYGIGMLARRIVGKSKVLTYENGEEFICALTDMSADEIKELYNKRDSRR